MINHMRLLCDPSQHRLIIISVSDQFAANVSLLFGHYQLLVL